MCPPFCRHTGFLKNDWGPPVSTPTWPAPTAMWGRRWGGVLISCPIPINLFLYLRVHTHLLYGTTEVAVTCIGPYEIQLWFMNIARLDLRPMTRQNHLPVLIGHGLT